MQRVVLISLLACLLRARAKVTRGSEPAEELLALQLPCAGRRLPTPAIQLVSTLHRYFAPRVAFVP